jgi:hypothetical protein
MIFGCIQHLDRNCYKLRTGLRFQLKFSTTETVRHLRHLLIFWERNYEDPQKPPAIHAMPCLLFPARWIPGFCCPYVGLTWPSLSRPTDLREDLQNLGKF